MQYWKIENIGAVDHNALTVLGGTTKRESDDTRIIGTFGTGSKQSVALLIRNGLFPVVFAGRLKMEYKTKPVYIGGTAHQQIFVQLKGKDADGANVNREEDLKTTLLFGSSDWDNIGMALREYVSNAIDALYEAGKTHRDIKIELVDDSQVRAKDGYTRVFIPASPEVNMYFVNIGQHFLHFGEDKFLDVEVINKSDRQEKTSHAKLYRRGVLVRKIRATQDIPALFDYNLCNLKLDDCRNYSEYGAITEISRALSRSDEKTLVAYFKSFLSGVNYLEHNLDAFYLSSQYGCDDAEARTKRWQSAWLKAFGDKGVVCSTEHGSDVCLRKGYTPVKVSPNLIDVFKKFDIKTESEIMTSFEQNDIRLEEATEDVHKIGEFIWSYLEKANRTNCKPMPDFRCFTRGMNAGAVTMGFCHGCVCAINKDIATGININLISTVLEEISHYITDAQDETRDLQTYAFDVAASLLQDLFSKK